MVLTTLQGLYIGFIITGGRGGKGQYGMKTVEVWNDKLGNGRIHLILLLARLHIQYVYGGLSNFLSLYQV